MTTPHPERSGLNAEPGANLVSGPAISRAVADAQFATIRRVLETYWISAAWRKMSSSICGVSLPVNVFCWLG